MTRHILHSALFVLASILAVACHTAELTHCPMLDCPKDKVCDGRGGCAFPEQLDVCRGRATGDACTYRDASGAAVTGSCTDGVCNPLGCGNKRVTTDEVCDDGNNESGDGCSADCRSNESCGNRVIDTAAGEQCDDGNVIDADGCQANCRPGRCGDAIVDAIFGEECDDGDSNSIAPDAGCRPSCVLPRCGDGVRDPGLGEQCDDGNNQSADGCSGDCRSNETCGNTVVDALAGEVCDDGNMTNGDGCAADCRSLEVCGNSVVDAVRGEVCDDGNTVSGDGCSSDCRSLETCGNSIVDAVTEQCDLGPANSDAPDSMCRTTCRLPVCGDTIIDPLHGEQCDDGLLNADVADACRTNCQNPRCGDAIRDAGEVCDDGNTISGDGCSASCGSLETCGNGIVDVATGEQCDNGAANSNNPNAACRPDCQLRKCGDAIVDPAAGESCDLGAANSNAANATCRTNCTPQRCGDGVLDALLLEVCDDGNVVSGDDCSSDCRSLEVCGNGIVDTAKGEQCDAAGANANTPNAPCRTTCLRPRCGDAIVDNTLLGEGCDDGAANSSAPDAACRPSCQPRRCGDGITDALAGEVCDDGNAVAGDGCSPDCSSLETCGNGIVDVARGEQCDLAGMNSNLPNASCRADCTLPRCGDNVLDNLRGEGCDQGAANSNAANAACRTNCQPRRCGDTVVDNLSMEVCDDGNNVSGDNCSGDCRSLEVCGNGIVDVVDGEQCDNGGLNSNAPNATCRTSCTNQRCGDAIVDNAFGEGCDLGGSNSNAPNAACRTNCTPRRCGDSVVDGLSGEVCDDGNNASGDNCSGDCKSLETCGNGIVDSAKGEQCDDGDTINNDECHNDCTLPRCGDGVLDFNEQCDLGLANSNNPNAACRPNCLSRRCGDGVRDDLSGEACDDGNPNLGDGCRPDCLSNETCGNGVLDPHVGEACDDGNTLGYDGCSKCETEIAVVKDPGKTPQRRVAPVLVYDGARQRVIMFGGRDNAANLADTWEWDGASWTQLTPEHAPPARYDAAAAYDANRKRIVMFGGITNGGYAQDTWEFDGVDWTQRAPATVPSARGGAAAAYDANRKRVILFGGTNGVVANNETWEWSGTNWTLLSPATRPPARSGARMAFDSNTSRRYVVLFGGTPADDHTYTFDGTNWTDRGVTSGPATGYAATGMAFDAELGAVVAWSGAAMATYTWSGAAWTVNASGTPTPTRSIITMTYDAVRKQVVLFGGFDGANPLSDTWLRTGTTWSAAPAFTQPSPRMRAGMGYDPLRKRIVLFGGMDGPRFRQGSTGATLGDTWEWDGRRWQSMSPSTPPSPRSGTWLDYDVVARTLRLYGGTLYQAPVTVTKYTNIWSYNGSAWTQQASNGRDSNRTAAMTYDWAANRIITWGGTDNSTPGQGTATDRTWVWSAATGWQQLSPAQRPTALRNAAIGYDPVLNRTILFSGVTDNGQTVDETWVWNNTTWTRVTTTVGPAPRSGHKMFYNPDAQRVLVFGASLLSSGEDIWEWAGTGWEERSVSGRVPSRYHMSAAYDAANHEIVAFGGRESGLTDIVYQGTARVQYRPNTTVEACTSAQVDYDGDGKAGCADEECWAACDPLHPPGTTRPAGAPYCGDSACTTTFESCAICPADCGACVGRCGDFHCDSGETAAACPNDC